jgi:hypothetical protein
MIVQACRFKRKDHAKWEIGVMIGTDSDETVIIIDDQGMPVANKVMWNYNLMPEQGCFHLVTAEVSK